MTRMLPALLIACALWAQEYKMTTYQVAFLRREIQEGHMAHIGAMAKSGKLILAGPFSDNGDLRGMFVFKATAEEAKELAQQDPAVKSGRLALEWRPWFSAEGIGINQGDRKK